MKTRSNYVSNSSSSSFILKESKATRNLTGNDWNEMIVDLFQNYGERLRECEENEEKYGFRHDPHPIFCAFDMKTDRKEAESYLKDVLDGWTATNCHMKDGILVETKRSWDDAWRRYVMKIGKRIEDEAVQETGGKWADAYLWCMNRDEIRNLRHSVRVLMKDGSVLSMEVPEKYLNMLEDKWDEMGICDNYDILKNKKARFAVHFDENEYYDMNGVSEDGGMWETESYTYERVCEVFAKWLVEHGRVQAGFTWRDLVKDTLTVNMHEG